MKRVRRQESGLPVWKEVYSLPTGFRAAASMSGSSGNFLLPPRMHESCCETLIWKAASSRGQKYFRQPAEDPGSHLGSFYRAGYLAGSATLM